MRRQGGEGMTRRTSSNSSEAPKPGAARYERPLRDPEDSAVDLANFRPISLTVSTFFKQVGFCLFIIYFVLGAVRRSKFLLNPHSKCNTIRSKIHSSVSAILPHALHSLSTSPVLRFIY